MQHLGLTDDEAAALTRELHDIVENDRYPVLPAHPPPKHYEPPSKGRYRRRGIATGLTVTGVVVFSAAVHIPARES
jgi:hypothetical protein